MTFQTQNFNIYNVNKVIIQTQNIYLIHKWVNKLFSEENKVPRTLYEARKVAGSATYKQSKVKQYEIVLSFKVLKTTRVYLIV